MRKCPPPVLASTNGELGFPNQLLRNLAEFKQRHDNVLLVGR